MAKPFKILTGEHAPRTHSEKPKMRVSVNYDRWGGGIDEDDAYAKKERARLKKEIAHIAKELGGLADKDAADMVRKGMKKEMARCKARLIEMGGEGD